MSSSENTILEFQKQESFGSNSSSERKYEEAAQIFDLISQLNSTLLNNTTTTTAAAVATTSESTKDSSSLSGLIKKVEPLSVNQAQTNKDAANSGKVTTKIPRINFLHNNSNQKQTPPQQLENQAAVQQQTPSPVASAQVSPSSQSSINMSSSASNSSMGSIPQPPQTTHHTPAEIESHIPRLVFNSSSSSGHQQQQQQPTLPPSSTSMLPTSRLPRSFVRNSDLTPSSTTNESANEKVANNNCTPFTPNGYVNSKVSGIPKRGVSLSSQSSKMKSTRSMSINDGSKENLDDCESVISSEGKKKVKYVIRHKPKESQVKIFSQKVEFKGKAKIGSLEKAATYTPSGGNVKIESHKVNWSARAKIGSLDHAAQYKPSGGNVKIESHKLNFREKARPKTDTGLIVVEEYLDIKSYNNSNDDLTKSQFSFTGSN